MSTVAAPAAVVAPTRTAGERLASIDVIRGLDILVMMFVNDVAGVAGTPAWMKHIEPPLSDGMTFVDVVFPAFLFIVGLSIPLALGRRALGEALRHVLVRAAALLVIGVFMVNSGSQSADALLPRPVWALCMYAGVIFVWGSTRRWPVQLRWLGAAILVAAALLYDHPQRSGLVELRPSWYGILGLIGWAYLVASLLYLAARNRLAWLGLGTIALYALFMVNSAGWLPTVPYLNVGSMWGSHAALVLSGAFVTAACLVPGARFASRRITFAVASGAVMALLAIGLHAFADVHSMFTINKILATPAWCLWSGALTIWIWAAVYWLLDVRRVSVPGRAIVEYAGQNALLIYILAPIFYALLALVPGGSAYYSIGHSFWPGLVRSLVFAWLITWAAAALRRRGMILKL